MSEKETQAPSIFEGVTPALSPKDAADRREALRRQALSRVIEGINRSLGNQQWAVIYVQEGSLRHEGMLTTAAAFCDAYTTGQIDDRYSAMGWTTRVECFDTGDLSRLIICEDEAAENEAKTHCHNNVHSYYADLKRRIEDSQKVW